MAMFKLSIDFLDCEYCLGQCEYALWACERKSFRWEN